MAKTLLDYGISCDSSVGQHYATCPECSPKRKNKSAKCLSVKVESDGTVWYCHHCQWKGSLREGIAGRSNPNGWKTDEWRRPELSGVGRWADQQLEHFERRGISKMVLDRNRVTVERVWIPQVEDFENAVAFPFYRAGELINVKYRGKNKNFRMATGAERIFCGLDDILHYSEHADGTLAEPIPQEIAYIVEGEMDKLAMEMAGFANTLSTPNGAPPKNAKDLNGYFSFLAASNYKLDPEDDEGLLDRIQTFVIAVDSDEPGQRLQEELVRRLGPDKCAVLRWPKLPLDHVPVTLWDHKTVVQPGDTLKDANEVLFCLGVEGLQQAVGNVRPVPIDGVYRVSDFKAELDEYYEKGLPSGIALPWEAFRNHERVSCLQVKTQLTWVVTGVPGHGKSRWVENVTVGLARDEDYRVAYFSPEVNPKQLHASYLISQYAGQPFNLGYEERMDRQTYERSAKWLDEHFFFLETGELPFTIDDLLERATKLVRKFGVNTIVIDPWNNVYHSRKHNEREDEYIGKALQRINAWRAKNNALAIIVAHPVKLAPIRNQEPVPSLNDIKGGSEWFAMADFGFSVWRDRMNEQVPTQVHIQKVKFQHLGTMGVAQLAFDKPTSRYYDALTEHGTIIPFGGGVQMKEQNRGRTYPPPAYETNEEAPYWMRGSEYDV